jgi:dTDP-4-amino-4,6-dideoxygalactose transaminase
MTNIDASLLIHQLDRIEDFLSAKEKISQKFNN